MAEIPLTVGAKIVALIVCDVGDNNVIRFDGLGIFAKVEIAVYPLVGGLYVGLECGAAVVTATVCVPGVYAVGTYLVGNLGITADRTGIFGISRGIAGRGNDGFYVVMTVEAGVGANGAFATLCILKFTSSVVAAGIEFVVALAKSFTAGRAEIVVTAVASILHTESAECVEAVLADTVAAFQFRMSAVTDVTATFTLLVIQIICLAVSVVAAGSFYVERRIGLAQELTAGGAITVVTFLAGKVAARHTVVLSFYAGIVDTAILYVVAFLTSVVAAAESGMVQRVFLTVVVTAGVFCVFATLADVVTAIGHVMVAAHARVVTAGEAVMVPLAAGVAALGARSLIFFANLVVTLANIAAAGSADIVLSALAGRVTATVLFVISFCASVMAAS